MTIQRLISWVKVGLIKVVDLLDHQPWDDFDRPMDIKYIETLSTKAAKALENLFAGFIESDGTIVQYKENIPRDSNIDIGDQCLWHGISVAMLALKFSVTGTSEIDLLAGLDGMLKHYVNNKLVRGVRADGSFQDDVSNDQLSGHLCGLYFAWKYGTDAVKYKAGVILHLVADELIDNSNRLNNQDGTPTTYGQLEQGWKTDPLRVTLLLAVLKFASMAANNPDGTRAEYALAYRTVLEDYYPLIKYPKVRFWSLDTQYDTHRAAIHLSILADLTTDNYDVKHRCCEGLLRIWKMVRQSANPWVYFLVRRQINTDPADLDNCLKHLLEYTIEDKNAVVEKINSTNPSIKTVQWGGNTRATQPVPRWRVGSQDFFWQRHLYSVDDWIGQTNPTFTHNCVDFLIAYWGFRNLNLINGER